MINLRVKWRKYFRQKLLNLKSTLACASDHFCIPAFAHVENVVQDLVVAEEAEEQEEFFPQPEAVAPAEELAP